MLIILNTGAFSLLEPRPARHWGLCYGREMTDGAVRMEFTGVVESARGGGALVRLPAEAAEVFGTRARFPVQATFNGLAYRGSTMPLGDGTFCVGITKAIRVSAGLEIGDPVSVTVERDDAERVVEVPPDLVDALRAHPSAAEQFGAMAYTHRREYATWVAEAKRPETRRRRIEQAVAMIAEGRPRS
jgi:hypothetical protein